MRICEFLAIVSDNIVVTHQVFNGGTSTLAVVIV